jgi:glutaminyl-peptide cyclotransferase
MKHKIKLFAVIAVLLTVFGCELGGKHKNEQKTFTITPEEGTSYKAGDEVKISVDFNGAKIDSVVYLIDSARFASKKDTSALTLKTDTMRLGDKLITAKVYADGQSQDVSTNIVLMAAKAPEELTYKVVKVFPHDTSCYTEGLLYQDGYLYESGGGQSKSPAGEKADLSIGQSSLRKVDLNTGKVLQKAMVDPTVFGEGISIVGDKIIQLTWKSRIRYVYDKNTFKLLNTLPNNIGAEGWGMCSDGNKLYMDDSTNRIWFINKDKWQAMGFVDVFTDKSAVDSINELEYINGKIYANHYLTNDILVIDPKTGAVLQKVDLTNLYPESQRAPNADVLNGIAYDATNNRIFITGKKWPHLYQVEFVKK